MLDFRTCCEYVKEGWLTMHRHPNGVLCGFKYSLSTVYEGHWDEVTLQCRGIVFNSTTGEIVAHPFDKFFNYQEIYCQDGLAQIGKILSCIPHFEPRMTPSFTAMEKVDGSLGILFNFEGQWIIKTQGSFIAEQSFWANQWLKENVDLSKLDKSCTYCFEIVYKGDLHVVKYDYEGLVLLSVFDKNHREYSVSELEAVAKSIGVRFVKIYEFNNINECIEFASKMDGNNEGFVITFQNGFKVKAKSAEYLELFHRMSCITYKEIRDHFNEEKGVIDPDYFAEIPEELVDLRKFALSINERVAEVYREVVAASAEATLVSTESRFRYEYLCKNHKNYIVAPAMELIKSNNLTRVYGIIWRKVKDEFKVV